MISLNLNSIIQKNYTGNVLNANSSAKQTTTNDFQYSLASSNAYKAYALSTLSFGNDKETNFSSALAKFKVLLSNRQLKKVLIKTSGDPQYEITIRKPYGHPTEYGTSPEKDVIVEVKPGNFYGILKEENEKSTLKSAVVLKDNEDYPRGVVAQENPTAKEAIKSALKQFESGQYNVLTGYMGVFLDDGIKPSDGTKQAIKKIFDRIKTVYREENGKQVQYTSKDLPYGGLKLVLNDGRILLARQTILQMPDIKDNSHLVQLSIFPHLRDKNPELTSIFYVNPDEEKKYGTILQVGNIRHDTDSLIDREYALPNLQKVINEVNQTKYLSPVIGDNNLCTIDYQHFDNLKELFIKARSDVSNFEDSEKKSIVLNVSGKIARFKSVTVTWPGENDSLRYHEPPSSRLELKFNSNYHGNDVIMTINTAGQIIKSNVAKQITVDLINRLLSDMPRIDLIKE